MRSVPLRLLSLAVLPAALLAGCADSSETPTATSSTRTVAAQGDFEKITVTPAKDSATAPTVMLPTKPFRTGEPVNRVLKEGTGAAIADPAWLDVHHAMFSGVDGSQMTTSYGPKTATLRLGEASTVPGFQEALKGKKIGTRALVAMPASAILNEQQLTQGMTLDDSVIFVIDVVDQRPVLEKATGAAVPPKPGLPTVTVPDDPQQPAAITVPSAQPIKATVTQPLITGTGKKVVKGQTVRVRYTGATWRDPATPFDYSGKSNPPHAEFPIGQGGLIKAWDNGIPGQSVGSRLLIVAQPADGYGSAGETKAGIKGTDVLIFVLDILDAYDN